MNKTPFNQTDDLKKQLLAVFETECIGFVTAWEYAERYTKSIGRDNPENDRFLVIIQALTIWINAKNLGVACGEGNSRFSKIIHCNSKRIFWN